MAFPTGARIGPYEILAALGAGGMGEVYKARDTRLDRIVALKSLPAEMIADPARKQSFLQEARAASRLNHPNIVTIYDLLEEDGASLIAMEYVAGETLERAIPEGGLPLDQAARFAAAIADALAAAHTAGIVHRDLKPANVIVGEDGRVKLLDFGLAKSIAVEDDAKTASITGVIAGTPAYMSPEQAEGRPVDARSDIFSFGLVWYEMLTGRRAFAGDSWIAILASILHHEPAPLRELRPGIPSTVECAVLRCLRKDPAERFQSMREIADAVSGATLPEEAPAADRPSIAVLPLTNLSGDKENEYFGDGLAEEIINALTKVPELRVIARASAFALRGQEADLRTIGRRLRVATVLEGSVRRSGNRIRIAAQLVRVDDESHLWSERYDRELTDIFAIQDEISQAIAAALRVQLAPPARATSNVEAFQSYLQGLYWYQRYTPATLARAKEAFEQALRFDPNYAPAYAGLAVFYFGTGAIGVRPMAELAPLARSAAEKALALDPSNADAHSVMGIVEGPVEYNWASAEQHFRVALAAGVVHPLVRVRYALYFLTPLARFEEAAEQYQRAMETDPLSMMVHYGLAHTLIWLGRYAEAIEVAQRAIDLYPDYWMGHLAMAMALYHTGDFPRLIATLEQSVQLAPEFSQGTAFLAAVHASQGDAARGEAIVASMRERGKDHYVASSGFAIYYASQGDADKMFEACEAAFAERDPYLARMDADAYFHRYRSDPRYQALRARMNLPDGK